jgi:hypothetical protein
MSFLSQPRTVKIKNTYINGFLDCSGDIILRSGNVIIGNISQPGYNANQRSLMVNGRTEMNGNLIVNGNLLVSSNNIALGLRAGNIINGIQDGVPNGLNTTAVGSFSGMNHTGQNNTFIGSVAGQTTSTTYFSRTGSNNTYLGYRTSSNNSAWGNSTAVGTGSVISASNQIVLGTAEESVSIAGNVRITNNSASTTTTTGALVVTGGIGVSGAIIAGGSIYAGNGNNRAVELAADAANTAYIDFHSLDAFSNDYDSRIKSIGGTSGTSSRGALTLESESTTITGNVSISKTTASTTTTTGALTITGGVGILGNINTGGFSTFTRDSSFSGNILLTQLNNPLWLVSRNASVINSTLSSNANDVGIFYGTTNQAAASLVISPRGAGGGIKMDIAGNVGMNNSSPRFTLDVAGIIGINNNVNNKKLVLYETTSEANPTTATNFYGFGINYSALRYQVDTNTSSHVFCGGNTEYMRIVGSRVGINTNNPTVELDVVGNIKASANITASTLNLSGAISGATATNTINGVVINDGAVSGVTTLSLTGLITQNNATYSSPGASIIGGRISGGTNSNTASIASGAVLLLYTLPITTAGVWLINYQASITVTTPSTAVGFVLAGLNTTSNSTAPTLSGSLSRMVIPIITGTPVPAFQLQGSYIYTTSATNTTIYLTSVTTATAIVTAAATSLITATRIA